MCVASVCGSQWQLRFDRSVCACGAHNRTPNLLLCCVDAVTLSAGMLFGLSRRPHRNSHSLICDAVLCNHHHPSKRGPLHTHIIHKTMSHTWRACVLVLRLREGLHQLVVQLTKHRDNDPRGDKIRVSSVSGLCSSLSSFGRGSTCGAHIQLYSRVFAWSHIAHIVIGLRFERADLWVTQWILSAPCCIALWRNCAASHEGNHFVRRRNWFCVCMYALGCAAISWERLQEGCCLSRLTSLVCLSLRAVIAYNLFASGIIPDASF